MCTVCIPQKPQNYHLMVRKKKKKQRKAENWKKRATHFTSKGGKLEKVSRQVIMSVEHLEEHFTKAHIWLQQPIMQLHLFHIFLPCCFKTGHLQVTSNIVAGMGCLLNSSKANPRQTMWQQSLQSAKHQAVKCNLWQHSGGKIDRYLYLSIRRNERAS